MSEPALIYLDHNATTPVAPEVVDAMIPWLRDGFANPSSDHRGGRRARAAIDTAREQVAQLVGAQADDVVFTSGGTESNNLALFGWLTAHPERPGVITSTIEHPAVTAPCSAWEAAGNPVHWVPPTPAGTVDPATVASRVDPRTGMISIMLANNETGAIQPIRALSRVARDAGVVLHSDGAQAVGKVQVDVRDLGVDLLTIAGHKLYGPKGIGALVISGDHRLEPVLRGAGQERGIRPGTENVASIVGLGLACQLAGTGLADEASRQRTLTEDLHARLAAGIPELVRTVDPSIALPNTLHVQVRGHLGSRILARARGLAASTGSACHEGVDHPSPVLVAMGLTTEDALGSLRLSVGRSTTPDDVARAAEILTAAVIGA